MSTSLFNKYVQAYAQRLETSNRDLNSNSESKFEMYKRALSKKSTIEVYFESADEDGNLTLVDKNHITVILRRETFEKDTPYYNVGIKDRFVGIRMRVKVLQIDEEKKIVEVVSSVDKDMIKGGLIKDIFRSIDAGQRLPAFGDVVQVKKDKVLVDILGRGILGIIEISYWQDSFTRDLRLLCKKGDSIKFDIVRSLPRRKGKDYAFACDRKPYAPNPWESIPDLQPGTSILVQCIDKPKNTTYFWGISKLTPGVEIMCNYNNNLNIVNSCVYKCKVLVCDKDKRRLKVVPFELAPMGLGTEENVSFISNRN